MRYVTELAVAAAAAVGTLGLAGQAEVDAAEPPSLVVSGEAEVASAPDVAVVRLGATAQATVASSAQQQVADAMQRALAALKQHGVPAEDVRTAALSLYPVYSEREPGPRAEEPEPRIVGYRAGNTVRVELRDLASIGAVIDAAVTSGVNELHGISFELRDDAEQRSEALRAAVRDARAKAEAMADAAGVRLVRLRRIEAAGPEGPRPLHAARASFDAGTPVEPGRVRTSASVTPTYRIEPLGSGGDGEGR